MPALGLSAARLPEAQLKALEAKSAEKRTREIEVVVNKLGVEMTLANRAAQERLSQLQDFYAALADRQLQDGPFLPPEEGAPAS